MNKEERKYIFAQLNSLPNAFQYVEVTNYIKSLEQQNKELAKEIDLWTSKYNKEFDKNKELHNKIDKAIELIECSKEHILEHDGSNIYLTQYCIDELLKILKGDVDDR